MITDTPFCTIIFHAIGYEVVKFLLITFYDHQYLQNYNESRVHAQRGVREMLIFLDGRAVFRGETNPAFDSETEYEPMGDVSFFF